MSWFKSNDWMNGVQLFIEYTTIDRRVNRPNPVTRVSDIMGWRLDLIL